MIEFLVVPYFGRQVQATAVYFVFRYGMDSNIIIFVIVIILYFIFIVYGVHREPKDSG